MRQMRQLPVILTCVYIRKWRKIQLCCSVYETLILSDLLEKKSKNSCKKQENWTKKTKMSRKSGFLAAEKGKSRWKGCTNVLPMV